jgi:hypothetical protein
MLVIYKSTENAPESTGFIANYEGASARIKAKSI